MLTLCLISGGTLVQALSIQSAWATTDLYPWSNCSYKYWQGTAPGFNVPVGVDPLASFPGDTIHDGNVWSFYGRISDAVQRWNSEILRYEPAGALYLGVSTQAFVTIDEVDPGGGAYGVTITTDFAGNRSCYLQKPNSDDHILSTRIHMKPYSNWFTEDDTQRAYWEGCPGRGYIPTYTCSKNIDFGGAITHELGHAWGLGHPEDIGSAAASLAKCSDATDYATMCAHSIIGFPFTSAGRTLSTYDSVATNEEYFYG